MGWSLIVCLLVILQVALLTLIERKYLSLIQRRIGPVFVGPRGKYQFLADVFKVIFKELTQPQRVNKVIFRGVTGFCFWSAWFLNTIAVYGPHLAWCDIDFHLFYVFIFSTLGGFSIMIAGLVSRSKYALLGAIRTGVQIISYEIFFNLICLHIVLLSSSLNFMEMILYQSKNWYIFTLFPISIVGFLTVLLECNRAPFDLPEAEAELVSGYNVEYGGILFAFFYLAEYLHIWLASGLYTMMFLGGYNFFYFSYLFFLLNCLINFLLLVLSSVFTFIFYLFIFFLTLLI